jgi:diguanylate cyclase (GGDEF)-like protein
VTLPFDWSLFWKIVWGILFIIMALIINQWAIVLYNRKLKNKEVVLKKEHGELQEQVNRDSLTLLYNRRYMMESAKQLIAFSKRQNEPLSIMMIDIDNFKIINDTYGHGAGDSVIKAIARTIKLYSRKSDIASRFGGEEFLLLLPNTSLEGAKVIGEKIRQEIEELKVPLANHYLMVTVSIGLSPIDIDYHEVLNENFWQLSDEALYEAKRTGKNRVVVKDSYKEEVNS